MHNIQQLLLVLSFFSLGICPSKANPISLAEARAKAEILLNPTASRFLSSPEVSLRAMSSTCYLFETDNRFALLATDDTLPEILGYGNKFKGEIPPPLLGYLNSTKYPALLSSERKIKPVPALLPFVRHQEAPYNIHCPLFKDSQGVVTDRHCAVGCVATALEEVISYYRRELVLQDTLHGWKTPQYTIEDILPGTRVDCRLIRDNYDLDTYTEEELDAVSRLCYYCGVAAQMKWGLGESAANAHNLIEPLKRAFGYKYVKYADSYQYSNQEWIKMMHTELQAHRPVYYVASLMRMGGHAFVVDGLDENGLFHVNWGYGGDYDGYFRLDVLNFSEPPAHETKEGLTALFFCNHQAIFLHPDSVTVNHPDTLQRTGYEIAIDSITAELPAETGKNTPIRVYFRNTTDQYLTTPFEFFTNATSDTALFEQADFIALGGTRMAPYATEQLLVHATFHKSGERLFRVSPDDKAILFEQHINIKNAPPAQLTFHTPVITYPSSDRILVTLVIENSKNAGRSGQEIIYDLVADDKQVMRDEIHHYRHLYVQPGEVKTDTISFHSMQPGASYKLLIRSPWKIKAQTSFTMPGTSGIEETTEINGTAPVEWYTIEGRKIISPDTRGIYLRRKGSCIEKFYINK